MENQHKPNLQTLGNLSKAPTSGPWFTGLEGLLVGGEDWLDGFGVFGVFLLRVGLSSRFTVGFLISFLTGLSRSSENQLQLTDVQIPCLGGGEYC
jgi:hypothetical protein